jgi:hypothetical protein
MEPVEDRCYLLVVGAVFCPYASPPHYPPLALGRHWTRLHPRYAKSGNSGVMINRAVRCGSQSGYFAEYFGLSLTGIARTPLGTAPYGRILASFPPLVNERPA